MRCLLLLCVVAFSCALPYKGVSKTINIGDDGTVEIIVSNGKRVVISKAVGNTDEKFIDISVEGPSLPIKQFRVFENSSDKTAESYNGQINDQYGMDEWKEKRSAEVETTKDSKDTIDTKDSKKSTSQTDLLHSIFSKYEGVVDELSYQTLLKEIEDYVASGQIDASIYDVLKYLHDQNVQEQTQAFIPNNVAPDQRPPSTYLVPRRWILYEEDETPQARLWFPQQQQWVPQQRQWLPEQRQFVPQIQQWDPQQQQWIPQQQQFVPQQQQFVPQQQQTTGQVSQQGPTYNPWIAYYLGQYWNQQIRNLAKQTPSPVNVGPVVGYPSQYPWQFESVNQGSVY